MQRNGARWGFSDLSDRVRESDAKKGPALSRLMRRAVVKSFRPALEAGLAQAALADRKFRRGREADWTRCWNVSNAWF